jgi:hypothetical protein
VPQAESLGIETPLVSSHYLLYSTSKWKTERLRLETSVRLTVTLCSQAHELCVDRFFVQIGWKLAEISFLECRHDRVQISIFILVLARVSPVSDSESVVFVRFSTVGRSLTDRTSVACTKS